MVFFLIDALSQKPNISNNISYYRATHQTSEGNLLWSPETSPAHLRPFVDQCLGMTDLDLKESKAM